MIYGICVPESETKLQFIPEYAKSKVYAALAQGFYLVSSFYKNSGLQICLTS